MFKLNSETIARFKVRELRHPPLVWLIGHANELVVCVLVSTSAH